MTAAVLKIPYFCPVVPDKETKLGGPRQGTPEVLDEGNWARPFRLVSVFAHANHFPRYGYKDRWVRCLFAQQFLHIHVFLNQLLHQVDLFAVLLCDEDLEIVDVDGHLIGILWNE